MLSAESLKAEHDSGVFDDRIHRLQAVREAVAEHCGLTVPRNVAETAAWYKDHKSVMTKRLNDATESDESTDDNTEGED